MTDRAFLNRGFYLEPHGMECSHYPIPIKNGVLLLSL